MNHITHIALILDTSASMRGLQSSVVAVVNNQIAYWAQKSKEWNHEIRVSLYTFDTDVQVHLYDMDVFRVPNISQFYHANGGSTNLIDGAFDAVTDLLKVPEIHAHHQFIAYTFTDGEHNVRASRATDEKLNRLLTGLADNYTVACFVPGANAKLSAKRYGFPAGNIEIWDTTPRGVEEFGEKIRTSTETLITTAKSGGARGTKTLFALNTGSVTAAAVKQKLECLNPSEYFFLAVRKDCSIKEFVENWKHTFRQGANYYQLTKTEKAVQANKQICLREKKTGKVYTGIAARQMLGLPDHTVSIAAASHPLYDIFIQSNSNNRKLVGGTELLVMQ